MIPNLGALPLCELAPAHHAILIEQELSRRAEKKILERDFAAFAKAAWHVVAPDRELVWNWHHDLICNYLEAFALRYIRNLQINIPPRCTKSILCAVLYPVWVWLKQPNHQFLTLSFKEDLSTRDAVASRNLMASEWFQRRWSDRFKFSGDTNAKTRYQNDHSGHRISSGMTSGVLGDGGDTIIIDDPHDPEGAQSDAQRATTLRSYDGQLITRLNDRRSGGILIFMQRLHDHDLCGHVLAREGRADQGGRWHRLVVPMRYDPELSLSTYPEAGKDPRTKPGELLDPIRFPRGEVDLLETTLGPYNVSGQHQQSPSPPGGGILKTAWWQMWPKERPLPKCREIFASLDTAFTERHHKEMEQTGHAARSACTVWGVFEEDNGAPGVMLIGSWADWIDWPALVKKAKETYDRHDPDYILIEKKASGISLLQDLKYQGIPVVEYTPDGDKIARAYACQSILSSGFVWYPDRAWAHEVVAECAAFPRGSLKDYPDTCTQAWLRIKKSGLLRRKVIPFRDPGLDDEEDEPAFVKPKKYRRVVGIYG